MDVPYPVEIDFDEASRANAKRLVVRGGRGTTFPAWRANKKKNKDGTFSYICGATRSNGKVCTKVNCKNVQHAKQKMTDMK